MGRSKLSSRYPCKRLKPLSLLVFCVLSIVASAEERMHLCRGEMYEPLAADERLESQVMNCALRRLDIESLTTEKPWLRCIHESRGERFAGVYPLAQMDYMIGSLTGDMTASAPIAIEKWYWLTQSELTDLPGLRFGAIRGSNQHVWLLSQGLNVTVESNSAEQLFRMLEGGRVDVILGTGKELPYAKERGIAHYFVRYLPLHAYFNRTFLDGAPDFIQRFNDQLLECQPGSWVSLSQSDRLTLAGIAGAAQSDISDFMDGLFAAPGRRSHLSQGEIANLDAIWSQINHPEHALLVAEVLNTPTAEQLRQVIKHSDGVIEELFLVNAQGLLVASSHMTTDYWQGDEAKFIQIEVDPDAAYFIDEVRYDQSSRHFLSQVSVPFRNEQSELMGILVVGIDVERALSEAPL